MIKNIDNTTREEREEVLNKFGKKIIGIRDKNLKRSMEIAAGKSLEKYVELKNMSSRQYDLVCDILSENMTEFIFDFLHMFEDYAESVEPNDWMKILVRHKNEEYSLKEISWKLGSEIAREDEDGWIQKFSKVGRFVL